jgi:hypothetical protein
VNLALQGIAESSRNIKRQGLVDLGNFTSNGQFISGFP